MEQIWNVTVAGIKKLLSSFSKTPEIQAISFSAQGGGLFLVDADGKPVRNAILPLDSRTAELRVIKEYTHIPDTALKMLWLKQNEPVSYQNVRWILSTKDWLRFCLTGEVFSDIGDPLLPVDNNHTFDFYGFQVLGIPECSAMLPPLRVPCDFCGTVSRQASAETGLPMGVPVIIGGHDMLLCSIGAGANHTGHITAILGTLGINIAYLDHEAGQSADDGSYYSYPGICSGHGFMSTSIGSGCRALDYYIAILYPDVVKELGINIFSFIEQKLAALPPTEILCRPYIQGTFYDPSMDSGFFGINSCSTRDNLMLAVYQGIAVSMAIEADRFRGFIPNPDELWLAGGGSKSSLWPQIFADVMQLPVRVATTSELAIRGAALCAAMYLGVYDSPAEFSPPKTAQIYEPIPNRQAFFQQQKREYKRLQTILTAERKY